MRRTRQRELSQGSTQRISRISVDDGTWTTLRQMAKTQDRPLSWVIGELLEAAVGVDAVGTRLDLYREALSRLCDAIDGFMNTHPAIVRELTTTTSEVVRAQSLAVILMKGSADLYVSLRDPGQTGSA